MKKTIVFFGCSMRGGHKVISEDELRQIQEGIEDRLEHTLASRHQTAKNILDSENTKSPSEIFHRDFGYLGTSNVAVFEISNPSLGVGGEIADARHLGIPVLCLWSASLEEDSISAYIRGMEEASATPFQCRPYENVDHALTLIDQFVKGNTA